MAYKGQKATAEFINNLKTLINAECTRRNKTNSVEGYGTGTWASFSPAANQESTIYLDAAEKLYVPIQKIDSSAPSTPSKGDAISIDKLYDKYTEVHKGSETYEQSGSGCSGTCTGFCTSCSGTCSGNCQGCQGTCSGACKDDCSGGCKGTCRANCANNCENTCSANCANDCSGSCKGNCQGCQGCSGSCEGNCQGCGGCDNTCSANCASGGSSCACGGNCWSCASIGSSAPCGAAYTA